MDKIFVSEMQAGQVVEKIFAVVKKDLKPFKDTSRGSYLALTIADKTGKIEARKWEKADEKCEKIKQGGLVHLKGLVEQYQGSLQIRIHNVYPADELEFDQTDFLPVTEKNIDFMCNSFNNYIESIKDERIKLFMDKWFSESEMRDAFFFFPAAKQIHHAYIGGLLEHSLEVAKISLAIAEIYEESDKDIIIAGALLHDIGKISEYDCGVVIGTTDTGKLIGHTAIGYDMINKRAVETNILTEDQKLHLLHIILSHHGELEFGAPISPQTIEAEIVHQADMASGKIKQFQRLVKETSSDDTNWSGYDRFLGRQIYRGFMDRVLDVD